MEPISIAAPNHDERTMAMLAHILQIVTAFIGPLVIFLVKRDSRFVRFHAAQALIWQAAIFCFWAIAIAFFFGTIFTTIAMQASRPHANSPPVGLIVGGILIWLLAIGLMILNLIVSIVYGIKANNGEWARYPIIGNWAWRLTGGQA